MDQTQLFSLALGLTPPWEVTDVQLDQPQRRLDITIDFAAGSPLACPVCGKTVSVHDTSEKKWRHLDFFQYQTFLHARVHLGRVLYARDKNGKRNKGLLNKSHLVIVKRVC